MATYVLLHGAYQGGWIWQPVATRLRATGHTVYTPTLDLTITQNFRELRERPKGQVVDNKKGAADNEL